MNYDSFKDLLGQENNFVFFIGVVEDVSDPIGLGRCKVRVFGIHTEDKEKIPTRDLPWATVIQHDESRSPNLYNQGTWVMGFFWDGRMAQYPVILGMIPGVTRPGAPGADSGTNTGYTDSATEGDYAKNPPYHGQSINGTTTPRSRGNVGGAHSGQNLANSSSFGNNIRDNGVYVHNGNKDSQKLEYYTWGKAPAGFACKDAQGSLRMHLSTALAFESLTKQLGGKKLTINSAYRSPAYNARVGGASRSQHTMGRAIDVSKRGMGSVAKFIEAAAKNGFVGFGVYDTFVHIDTGTGRFFRGGTSEYIAAAKRGGWYPGKRGLQGVKFDQKADNKAANTPAKSTTDKQTQDSIDQNSEPSEKTENQGNQSGSVDKKETNSNPQTRNEVKDYVASRMKAEGYSDSAIAGVQGNLQNESNFNPGANNPNDKGKQSFGLAQWRGDRLTGLQNYSANNNKDYRTAEAQVDYMLHELNTSHKSAGNALKNASSPSEAAFAFGSKYEIFQGSNDINNPQMQSRIRNANDYAGGASTSNAPITGFHDPTNSYPEPARRGNPTTHEAARGLNSTPYDNPRTPSRSVRTGGYPVAGNTGTFGAPESGVAPQYPHNKVWAPPGSGHILEMDDTPGAERVQLTHKSGTIAVQITANGSSIQQVVGNAYKFDSQDSYWGVNGNLNLTSVGDTKIRSTSDITIQSDGSTTELIYNDKSTTVSGKLDILVGGVVQIKAASKIIIESGDIQIYSTGKMVVEAEGDLDLSSKGKLTMSGKGGVDISTPAALTMSATGKASLKGSEVALDDVVKMAMGLAKDAAIAKDAESADLGKAPGTKSINKVQTPSSHPDAHVTESQAARVYGQAY